MAISQAGKQVTAAGINEFAGSNASMITDLMIQAMEFRSFLIMYTDQDFIDLGLTQEQINIIKGAYVDELHQVKTLLDSTIWVKQLLGMGV